jgi:CRISPR/Cas system-associated exonuclease Cas4 (RecB family)
MARFFSSGAIEFGPWSPSKAGVLKECPLKFIWQYVEKPRLSTSEKVVSDDLPLVMGSAVHKYAEHLVNGISSQDAEKDAFKEVPLTRRNKLTIRSQKRGIASFKDRMDTFKSKNKVILDAAELRLAVMPDLTATEFWNNRSALRGILDRLIIIDRGGDRHAIAIDLKTGREKPIETYSLQLESYGVLLHSAYDLKSVSMAAYFSSTGALVWHPRKIKPTDIVEDNPVFTTINELVETIDPSGYKTGRHCNWCNYQLLCKKERDSL